MSSAPQVDPMDGRKPPEIGDHRASTTKQIMDRHPSHSSPKPMRGKHFFVSKKKSIIREGWAENPQEKEGGSRNWHLGSTIDSENFMYADVVLRKGVPNGTRTIQEKLSWASWFNKNLTSASYFEVIVV